MERLTKDQFRRKYHEFHTSDRQMALTEVSQIMVEGDQAVVVEMMGEYCDRCGE